MIELGWLGTADMPAANAFVEYLLWLTIGACLVLYLRLRQQGLHRVYRVFAAFVLFRAARATALAALPPIWYGLKHRPYVRFANNVYGWGWTLTEPLLWVLHVLVVLELYSLVLQNYKGVASMGRWAVLAGLAIAIVLSSLTLPAELSHSAEHSPILRVVGVAVRAVDTSLVLFLLFITAFLVWFPIPLTRNVVLYSMVYAFYFTTGALAELARNLLGQSVWSGMNVAAACLQLLCFGIWTVFLNRAGESKTVVVRHALAPQHEEILVQQLAAINASLMRSGPRP